VVLSVDAECAEADRARLRQLPGEHRARPGRAVRPALDLFDRNEIAEAEPPQLERRQWTLRSASGTRRYSGRISSTGRSSPASCTWKRARGTWRSSSSGGTTPPL